MAHRNGTYLQKATERAGGTCGSLPEQVIKLDSATALGSECAHDAPDEASADQCSFTRSYTCSFAEGSSKVVAITKEHDGGARFTGLLTITVSDTAGAFVCTSTYDVSAVRQ